MHDDQLAVDTIVARGLIVAQFPQFRDEAIVRVRAAGTENVIFRVGHDAAARFPLRLLDPEQASGRLRREAAGMVAFAGQCPFPTPRPLGVGLPGPGYPMPWLLQSWVEGAMATPDGHAASDALADDLARLIASLRRADTLGRRFAGTGRGGRIGDHDGWMAICFERSGELLDVPRLRRLWARFRTLPPPQSDAMCHGDLIPANLLVRGGRLAGVLDTGGYGPADPALDLVCAWHLFDRQRRGHLRGSLACGEEEWQRGAAWAFQQAMGLVWYYRATNPPMSALGRSTLRRIMTDPDVGQP